MTETKPFESAIDHALARGELPTAQRLVYADYLDEIGDFELAVAQRWLAERQRFARRSAGSPYTLNDDWFVYDWLVGKRWHHEHPHSRPAILPRRVWVCVPWRHRIAGEADDFKEFPTRRAAEAALAAALAALTSLGQPASAR